MMQKHILTVVTNYCKLMTIPRVSEWHELCFSSRSHAN